MPTYEVTVARTELIAFEVDAPDADQAEDRYLMDGEETGSKTGSTVVESVTLVGEPDEVPAGSYRCSCGSDVVAGEQAAHQARCGGHPVSYGQGATP
jgi:hypothetical protein